MRTAILTMALLASFRLQAQTIILGEEDRWRDVKTGDGIAFVEGKYGYLDAVIRDNGYKVEPGTDMLLNFERSAADLTGNYALTTGTVTVHPKAARLGNGGGVFADMKEGISYTPGADALFAENRTWNDISIEFWMYPALLDEGSTILHWEGAFNHDNRTILKEMRVFVANRILSWEFKNIFTPADLSPYTVELSGTEVLVPKRWHHHLFRYDGDTGLAEYLIDGTVVAITHTTATGREASDLYTAYTGNSADTTVSVGAGFTGFLDELRISNSFVENPILLRYRQRSSILKTRIFDLTYTNSRLISISADYTEPANSTLLFSYRLDNSLVAAGSTSGTWIPFQPGVAFTAMDRGRYLQLAVTMFPDGEGRRTPLLHSIKITYQPDLPPHPPQNIQIEAGDREFTIHFHRSLDPDVAGYLLYYGSRSKQYTGDDGAEGISPVDMGNVDTFTLTGLSNGRLYYVAVVAYDSGTPPHQSEFSHEVSIRPAFGKD